jgi:hypothetical protein
VSSVTRKNHEAGYAEYEAFGAEEKHGAIHQNKFGFTGHETDLESGLIYAKARSLLPSSSTSINES